MCIDFRTISFVFFLGAGIFFNKPPDIKLALIFCLFSALNWFQMKNKLQSNKKSYSKTNNEIVTIRSISRHDCKKKTWKKYKKYILLAAIFNYVKGDKNRRVSSFYFAKIFEFRFFLLSRYWLDHFWTGSENRTGKYHIDIIWWTIFWSVSSRPGVSSRPVFSDFYKWKKG